MDGITFGAKLHERCMHVLVNRAAHFGQADPLMQV